MIKEESIIGIIINALNQARRATVYELGCEILEALPDDLPERDMVKAIILQKMDRLMSDDNQFAGGTITREPAGAGSIRSRAG